MNRKIGILTFHNSSNYGAVLQALALNVKINNLGATCETIDYSCPAIYNANLSKNQSLKDVLKNIYKKWKLKKCAEFLHNNIPISIRYNSISEINDNYYAIIVGSDQVWNDNCTNNDTAFYLKGVNNNIRKFSFAASIGLNNQLCKEIIQRHQKELNQFDTISFREIMDVSSLNIISGPKIRYDQDPVFLLSKDEWMKYASPSRLKEKYIFEYYIGDPINAHKMSLAIAKKTGYKIISNKDSLEFIKYCSPNDFLSWILNAEYIVTNSFHGTAFSIIFNKRFFTECNGKEGYNNRIGDLLSKMKLEGRDISNNKKVTNVEWNNVNTIINNMCQDSTNYLVEIINS